MSTESTSPSGNALSRFAPLAMLVAGLVAAAAFALSFPAVEGLGTKVRLPVFHGAMTWVNLAAFSFMGLLAVAYLISRRAGTYRLEEAVRYVAVSVWLVGSGLGLMAALNTWDFTGSKASPLAVAAADPRLVAQLWVVMLALGVLALGLLLDDRRWLAAADLGFVAIMWLVLMQAVLGPGRALHPDSPVMNSDEIIIKALFFGIVGSLAVAFAGGAWLVFRLRRAAHERWGHDAAE